MPLRYDSCPPRAPSSRYIHTLLTTVHIDVLQLQLATPETDKHILHWPVQAMQIVRQNSTLHRPSLHACQAPSSMHTSNGLLVALLPEPAAFTYMRYSTLHFCGTHPCSRDWSGGRPSLVYTPGRACFSERDARRHAHRFDSRASVSTATASIWVPPRSWNWNGGWKA